MKRSTVILVVLSVLAVLAVSATAAVAAPGGSKKPRPTTTTSATTTTTPSLRTCQTLGIIWVVGQYNESQGNYTVSGEPGLPVCIDVRPEHAGARTWQVEWNGAFEAKPGMRGLRLVFESGVHDLENAYFDTVVHDTSGTVSSGTLTPLVTAPEATPFVFVAMPHSGDKWISMEMTLTPSP